MAEIITLDDSPQPQEINPPKRKLQDSNDAKSDQMAKAKCGEDVAISPAFIAKVRRLERNTSSNVIGSFYALTASAQNLLPGKAISLSKEKLKDMVAKQGEEVSKDPGSAKKQDEQSKKKEDINKFEFYCELCDAQANSELSYETHIQGKKHQKKLAASLGERGRIFEEDPFSLQRSDQGLLLSRKEKLGATPKIQPKLDDVDVPVIGLNYVAEIWRLDPMMELTYYCDLCQSTCQPVTIINHIIGYKHRLYYMKENHHTMYEKVKSMNVKKSELSKILEENARGIERREGRGQMKVEEETEERFSPEPFLRSRRDDPFGNFPYHPRQDDIFGNFPHYPRQDSFGNFPHHPRQDDPFGNFAHHPRDAQGYEYPSSIDHVIEQIPLYPSSIRMEMLKELVDIDPQELRNSMDASRLEAVIRNFQVNVDRYHSKHGNSGGIPVWDTGNTPSSRGRLNLRMGNPDRQPAPYNDHDEGDGSYWSISNSPQGSRMRPELDRTRRDMYPSSSRGGFYDANF